MHTFADGIVPLDAGNVVHVPPAQSASAVQPLQTQLRFSTVHLQLAKSGLPATNAAHDSGVFSLDAGGGDDDATAGALDAATIGATGVLSSWQATTKAAAITA